MTPVSHGNYLFDWGGMLEPANILGRGVYIISSSPQLFLINNHIRWVIRCLPRVPGPQICNGCSVSEERAAVLGGCHARVYLRRWHRCCKRNKGSNQKNHRNSYKPTVSTHPELQTLFQGPLGCQFCTGTSRGTCRPEKKQVFNINGFSHCNSRGPYLF